MKIRSILISGIVAGVVSGSLVSCSEESRLAKSLEGAWTGSTLTMSPNEDPETSLVSSPTLTFIKDDNINGGTVKLTGLLGTSREFAAADSVPALTLNAAGTVEASGTWQAIDGDEVVLNLDPSSIKVDFPGRGVVVASPLVTSAEDSLVIAAVRPKYEKVIATELSAQLADRLGGITKFDDVEVKHGTLSMEQGRTQLLFQKK